MTIDSLKRKIKTEGIGGSLLYYISRLLSKIELQIVGRMTARYGKLHKNYIVLKNRTMQDMTDNPKAFFEYLIQNGYNENYEIIWMVSEKKKFRNLRYKNVKFVTAETKYGWSSPLAYYYGAVAGFFFYTNNTAYLNLYHCKGQITVNLWHGCGYKDVAKEGHEPPAGKSMMHFDYALVPGPVFVDTKSRYWKTDKNKILPLGYPRYDWMLHPSLNRQELFKKLLGSVPEKAVIWMPTFRKSDVLVSAENGIELPFQLPALKNEKELQELDAELQKQNVVLLIKKHPLQSGWNLKEQDYTSIRYITEEKLEETSVQLYELVGSCDALISDYSSIAVDYMLLDRPIGYVLTDLDRYKETRGFVFDDPLKYMPGEKIYDLNGLKKFIRQAARGEDDFGEQRRKLLPQMHTMPVKKSYCQELAGYLELEKNS